MGVRMTQEKGLGPVVITVIVSFVTALVTATVLLLWVRDNPESFARTFDPSSREENRNGITIPSSDAAVVNAVKKANPAVVAITISKDVPVYERYVENIPGPFGDFFGNDFFGFTIPRLRQEGTQKQKVGGGSGFLVSEDGYIVTNRHVVEDKEAEYTVFLNDGTKNTANVVARDPVLDLAIIKIDTEKSGSDLPYLAFGDSDSLEVGQTAIAIGNALAEFRNTVSVGVVSGLSRSIVATGTMGGAEVLDQLIQTDAGINQGNSGGPLLNLSGDVIGVNVAVASGAENIGFAISGNSAKSVIESVRKNGRIIRPYLGVRYIPITEELAEQNDLPVKYGVLVKRGSGPGDVAVIPSSPADKAGIVENDSILEIDGIKLISEKSLADIIRSKDVGDVIRLRILRDEQEKTVTITLEEMKI